MFTNSISLKRIKLTLARSKDFHDGSIRHGYEFVAPIDEQGLIDPIAWKASRADCTVRRFWAERGKREVGRGQGKVDDCQEQSREQNLKDRKSWSLLYKCMTK